MIKGLFATVMEASISEMPTTLTPQFFPVPAANSRGPAPLTRGLSGRLVVLTYVAMQEVVTVKAVAAPARSRRAAGRVSSLLAQAS